MLVNSAIQEFLYFAQAWKIVSKLAFLLDDTDVPHYRMDLTKLHNLQWLDGQMENHWPHRVSGLGEARRLLTLLFHDSRYRALGYMMWRSVG